MLGEWGQSVSGTPFRARRSHPSDLSPSCSGLHRGAVCRLLWIRSRMRPPWHSPAVAITTPAPYPESSAGDLCLIAIGQDIRTVWRCVPIRSDSYIQVVAERLLHGPNGFEQPIPNHRLLLELARDQLMHGIHDHGHELTDGVHARIPVGAAPGHLV